MVRRKSEQKVTVNENMRGGEGAIRLEALLSAEELYEKGRLFSRITVKPGCSIGYHVHENEMESYVVVGGSGEYNDNGGTTTLHTGDVTLTVAGQGHGVTNNTDTDFVLLALILHKN